MNDGISIINRVAHKAPVEMRAFRENMDLEGGMKNKKRLKLWTANKRKEA